MRRSIVAPVAVVLLSTIAGGWLLQEGVERAENVYVRMRVLQEVVARVESSYVDEIEPSQLYNSAIQGLIDDLGDPHSSLIPASDYENLRIRTEGEYGGVGLEVSDRDGYVTVVSAIEGGPSERVGVRAGDRFHAIDGVTTDSMSTDQAVDLLRGRPGSEVTVTMLRPGVENPIDFTIEREEIRLNAVPFSLMLDGDVGYVPLRTVSETSADEISAALDSLQGAGMKAAILDLRGNLGGLLDQGIAVTDLFVDRGDVIVETRGRAEHQSEVFRASREDRYPQMPLVVLVDAASASAAEIIAGALQDHERAVVIGETTYGKGSVQSLFPLTGGDVLRLTTARWYTPLGRSIHMDPADRSDVETHGLSIAGQPVQTTSIDGRPEFTTESGRIVYGGGGIPPDLFVAPEELTNPEMAGVQGLFTRFGAFSIALFNYAVRYVQDHPDLQPGFRVSDAEMDELFTSLAGSDAAVSREDFDRAERFVRYHLEREIATQAWGESGRFLQSEPYDRQVGRALELLRGASTPAELLSEVTAAEAARTR